MLLQDFEIAAQAKLEGKRPHDARKKTVQRAEAQPVHRVDHRAQHAAEVPGDKTRHSDLPGDLLRLGGISRRARELLQDLVEEFPRGLAGEGERGDPLGAGAPREQPDVAIGQRVGFARTRGGQDHLVAGRFHGAPLQSTLAAVPWWKNPENNSSSSRAAGSAGGQKTPAWIAALTPSAQRRAAPCTSRV